MSQETLPHTQVSPDQVRSHGNRLRHEASVYLQQHAHNPVDWYAWSPEALERAKAEDKPIFLSIGYSSCHWCHVMEHEVFEHHDVAEVLNSRFVCIKVDREERPDLDAVYMHAVQLLTGSGGWPMSLFLTPEGKPFFAGTYFQQDAFLMIAERAAEVFQPQRVEVEQQARTLVSAIAAPPDAAPGRIDLDLLDDMRAQAELSFDPQWGGFRSRMKFPTPVRWQFVLHEYRRTGRPELRAMLSTTLDAMASGGIHDQVGGGFHRYSVDARWVVPHFEKMLYDNALLSTCYQLASLYLEAAAVFGESRWLEVAQHTLDFLVEEMTSDSGGLCASFDADSTGGEGEFYVWSVEQITRVVGADSAPVLCRILGVAEQGNFETGNVLTRRVSIAEVAKEFGQSESQIEQTVARGLGELRSARAHRAAPRRDDKVVTSWNGLAIAALVQGYALTGSERYRSAAETAFDYLWRVHRSADGSLARVSDLGRAQHAGVLDDYAALAWGAIELHQATGEVSYLARAIELVDYVIEHFNAPDGLFYTTHDREQTPLGRSMQLYDAVEPSGCSMMLSCMLHIAAVTGNASLRDRVLQALRGQTARIRSAGLEMAGWADVAARALSPFAIVVVAGDSSDERTHELARVVLDRAAPFAMLVRLPAHGPDPTTLSLLPTTQGKTAVDGAATAYACHLGACDAPTHDPQELLHQILIGWTC